MELKLNYIVKHTTYNWNAFAMAPSLEGAIQMSLLTTYLLYILVKLEKSQNWPALTCLIIMSHIVLEFDGVPENKNYFKNISDIENSHKLC